MSDPKNFKITKEQKIKAHLEYLDFDVSVGLHVDVDQRIEPAVDLDKFTISFRLIGRAFVHVEPDKGSGISL